VVSSVTVRYFDGCPNWRDAVALVRSVLDAADLADVPVRLEPVETEAEAERLGFVGSPTILIDGHDPFREQTAAVGLACRLFATDDGLRGLPARRDLERALI